MFLAALFDNLTHTPLLPAPAGVLVPVPPLSLAGAAWCKIHQTDGVMQGNTH